MNSLGVKSSDEKESLIYNPKIRSIFFQVLALVIVFGGLILLRHNTLVNLEDRGKSLGFHFLNETSGFSILPTFGTWVVGYEVGVSTYVDVFVIGVLTYHCRQAFFYCRDVNCSHSILKAENLKTGV